MSRIRFAPTNARSILIDIAKDDRAGRTCVLAGRTHLVGPDYPILALCRSPRRTDPLDAVSTLLHHATSAYGYLWILLSQIGFKAEIGVFLAVGVPLKLNRRTL